jgi:surface antigen/soluble lytic murein transglycosylase-like protein
MIQAISTNGGDASDKLIRRTTLARSESLASDHASAGLATGTRPSASGAPSEGNAAPDGPADAPAGPGGGTPASGPASGRSAGRGPGFSQRAATPLGKTVRVVKASANGVKYIGHKGLKASDRLRSTIRSQGDMDHEDFSSRVSDVTSKTLEQTVRKGAPKTLRAGVSGVKGTAKGGMAAYRGGVRAVNGTRSMFAKARSAGAATARTARRAAEASRQSAAGALRAARMVNAAVRFIGAKIGALLASVASMPLMLIMAVVAIVLAVIVSILAWIPGMVSESDGSLTNVSAQYVDVVMRAGQVCDTVTPPAIAAQIEQESGWNPQAQSAAGAQGIAQFMPGTWASSGKDGDGDGRADVMNPIDAIWSEGNYMCGLAGQLKSALDAGRVSGDLLDLTLAAYNAGIGNVYSAHGIPQISETVNYVRSIRTLMAKYVSTGGQGGGASVGSLKPPLVMSPDGYHVDVAATGTNEGAAPSYQRFQCTWWAAIRRSQIGKPVDPYMGNGGQWGATAARLGYPMGGGPRPGDAISFHPGVHGSDPLYGHVAIVEEVKPDGSIVISQSGTGWMAVVVETISKQKLDAMGSGVDFIH